MTENLVPAALRKVPPWLEHAVSLRGIWSLCALERSRFGPVYLEGPGVPFHHLGLPLDEAPLKTGMRIDGHRHQAAMGRDEISVIAAGDSGAFWWDRPMESACFYFTDDALAAVLDRDVDERTHDIRSAINRYSPVIGHLLRALHADALAGQPHGRLVGDSIFTAVAAQLVPPGTVSHGPLRATVRDRRVRLALDYIHAHLADALDLQVIAAAAASSPFHLSRCFRAAVGCSIWRYVLRERARRASVLMKDASLTLGDVAQFSGFETYASFVAAVRREFRASPAVLRGATTARLGRFAGMTE